MEKSLQDLYNELRAQSGGAPRSSEDPFIVKLSQLILSYSLVVRASDIHIEPTPSVVRVRYRIDGMLYEMLKAPMEIGDPLIRSIKVKANLATESVGRSKPQDSRIDFESMGRKLDLRLSAFPTLHGDVLAIRILDRSAPLMELDQLGFPPAELERFKKLIKRPNGMLLVTGTTNSGKTTTLYAALNTLRSPNVKIVTLEDPVEYQLDGVDQAQINPAVGVTFASGLRAILRQDANVLLIGEMRDRETAEIGIRAALTGHLVFSTLHTRDACGAAARLIDMEIEPHLIVAALNGILGQRLVRIVCADCKQPDTVSQQNFAELWRREAGAEPPSAQLVKGAGCDACNQTGYRGRVGVYELLILTDDLKRLVLERDSNRLVKAVRDLGFRTMRRDGLEKAARGITSVEEVLRVTGESEDV